MEEVPSLGFNLDTVKSLVLQFVPKELLVRIAGILTDETDEIEEADTFPVADCLCKVRPLVISSVLETLEQDFESCLIWLGELLHKIVQADALTLYVRNKEFEVYESSWKTKDDVIIRAQQLLEWTLCTEQATRHDGRIPIKAEDTIAGHVAATMKHLVLNNLTPAEMERFPSGIGYNTNDQDIAHVLALPLLCFPLELVGVIALYRKKSSPPFSLVDYDHSSAFTNVFEACIYKQEIKDHLQKLVSVCKGFYEFNKSLIVSCDEATLDLARILKQACASILADRATLFVFYEEESLLVAEYFSEEVDLYLKGRLRCTMNEGIVGYVARTHYFLNIDDCYAEEIFLRGIDAQTGYVTRNMIAGPVFFGTKLTGVVEFLNKADNMSFTGGDVELVKILTSYVALILNLDKLLKEAKNRQHEFHAAANQLQCHAFSSSTAAIRMENSLYTFLPPEDMNQYLFPYTVVPKEQVPQVSFFMFTDALGVHSFPKVKLCRFILSICNNYHDVMYHNICHAFGTLQCCYAIIKQNPDWFTIVEKQALLISAFCHDTDHPGLSNNFLRATNDFLSILYPSSLLENHHYDITVTIMQEKGLDILAHLPTYEYKQILHIMQTVILATDLGNIWTNINNIKEELDAQDFNILKPSYRMALNAIVISSCDLVSVCKPLDVYLEAAYSLYEEFHMQGDIEKGMKRKPPEMLDRNFYNTFPKQQLNFIRFVLPVYEQLSRCLGNTVIFLQQARDHCDYWSAIMAWQEDPFRDMTS